MNGLESDLCETMLMDRDGVVIYIPDNGRDGDRVGRTGSIVIYEPEDPTAVYCYGVVELKL